MGGGYGDCRRFPEWWCVALGNLYWSRSGVGHDRVYDGLFLLGFQHCVVLRQGSAVSTMHDHGVVHQIHLGDMVASGACDEAQTYKPNTPV